MCGHFYLPWIHLITIYIKSPDYDLPWIHLNDSIFHNHIGECENWIHENTVYIDHALCKKRENQDPNWDFISKEFQLRCQDRNKEC